MTLLHHRMLKRFLCAPFPFIPPGCSLSASGMVPVVIDFVLVCFVWTVQRLIFYAMLLFCLPFLLPPRSHLWFVWYSVDMPAATMFSKFKSGTSSHIIENNPITQFFEIGKQTSCGGPEFVWHIHDAIRKVDGRVSIIDAHFPLKYRQLVTFRV